MELPAKLSKSQVCLPFCASPSVLPTSNLYSTSSNPQALKPHSLHPYNLHPTPYTLHPTPCTPAP